MLRLRIYLLLFILVLLNACVTINVYFPAAAAEKAADQIIDKVWGTGRESGDQSEPLPEEDRSEKEKPSNSTLFYGPQAIVLSVDQSLWSNLSLNLINFFISSAYAGPNLEISTPAIQALQTRMTERHQLLESLYHKGAIGLTYDGLIALRHLRKVPLKMRSDVTRWISEENEDRLSLYRQIAVANGHPEWAADIQTTFASRWIERALSGWWYQNKKGQWQQR